MDAELPADLDAGSPPVESTAAKAPAKPKRRGARIVRALVVCAIGLAVVFGVWWVRYRPYVHTDDARVAAPVVVVTAENGGGRVERVHVREGDVVEAGQLLIELDDATARARVERATASVKLAEARVEAARAQVDLETQLAGAELKRAEASVESAKAVHQRTVRGARKEDIEKARADLAAAQAQAVQAEHDRERAESLASRGSVAAANLDSARTAEAAAQATLAAREAALRSLEHGRPEDITAARGTVMQAEAGLVEAEAGGDRVALRTRQLEQAQAEADAARADLALAEIALQDTRLVSHTAGVVIRVAVDPGDHLSPGQGAVTVVDIDHAWIAANIEETSSSRLRPGQPVSISIDEGGELSGHVDVITQTAASQFALIPADNAAGNFTKVVQRIPIRIALDPSPRISSLRVGQSVVVRIEVL